MAGATVLASHACGFAGVRFNAFLSATLYELGIRVSPSDSVHGKLLYLSSPNGEWPEFIMRSPLNLDNWQSVKYGERIELLATKSRFLSAECIDFKRKLAWKDVKVTFQSPAGSIWL